MTEYNYEDLKKLHIQMRRDDMPTRRMLSRKQPMDDEQFNMLYKYGLKMKERYGYTIIN